MAHLHSVYDTDAHFKIDGVTRGVKNASQTKTMLIQHDHNSERFTFELPKMIDGHDMSKCNVVEIHYINIDSGNKTNQYAGVYEVDDFQVSPDSDDVVICSWLISSNATQYVGNLSFVLRFVCSTNGKVDYAWNTAVHSGVFVSKGICNGDMVAEEYADILEKWRHELTSGEVTDERIAEVFEAYMEENPIELPDLSVYVKSVNNSKPDKNGNVTVKIPEPITDYVKTVNGAKPVNGNVTVEIPKTGVQTVNGQAPDANGNVEIEVSGGNVDQEQIEQAVEKYLTEHPAGCALTIETITVDGSGDSGTTEPENIPVTGLSLDLTAYNATVGGAFYINPAVIPSNATNRSVRWESSNNSVATVDENGYVECIAQGDAIITCITADGGYRATCSVAVAADSGGDSGGGEPEPVYYTITKNLTNATINNSASSVLAGTAYTANITAASGYELSSITVVMGGVNITSTAVSGNTITIAAVTGNVTITITGVAESSGETLVYFKDSAYPLVEGSLMKANGTTGTVGGAGHLAIPYTEGITISTCMNSGWNTSTYPHFVVLDNGTYTAVVGSATGGEAGLAATQYVASFTGYSNNAVIYANMNKVDWMKEDHNAYDDKDTTEFYYYIIPGGES